MPIWIDEVLSGKKTTLETRDPNRVGMYVCGVTVYDRCHIGHLRSMLSFDALVRYLEYQRYQVRYVRNFTDVDDKIIDRAREIEAGPEGQWRRADRYATFGPKDWALRDADDAEIRARAASTEKPLALVVSEYFIEKFQEDFSCFGMRVPDVEPKVSDHMPQIVAYIERIISRGYAYEAGGDVYFDVTAYDASTHAYGKLSRRDAAAMIEGARVSPSELKRCGADFALWKAQKPGEPAWPSPWGPGRPGWHIECSVMSTQYLGVAFDIHGGGKDLIFPHHENEIAQAEAAGDAPFCRNWLHNGFVTVDGVKMSKSLGNFLSLFDALELALPEVWRFLVQSVHYQSPIDFSRTRVNEAGERVRGSVDVAAERVQYFYTTLSRAAEALAGRTINADAPLVNTQIAGRLKERFCEAMDDNFNTAIAITLCGEAARAINELVSLKSKEIKKLGEDSVYHTLHTLTAELIEVAGVLGLFSENPETFLTRFRLHELKKRGLEAGWIEQKIIERGAAKAERDFARADAIRLELDALGIELRDSPGKTLWDVRV